MSAIQKSVFLLAGVFLFSYFSFAHERRDAVHVRQGWVASDTQQLNHVDEGSRLIPLYWFLALESPTSQKPFLAETDRYGMLRDLKSTDNPYGLPLGFGVNENTKVAPVSYGEKKWVGISCTACHTGSMKIGKKPVVFYGGAGRFDLDQLESALLKSMDETLVDSAKYARFVSALPADANTNSLHERLEKYRDQFKAYVQRSAFYDQNGKVQTFGPGRIDGLGLPDNETLCHTAEMGDLNLKKQLADPRNCRPGQVPARIPRLWGVMSMQWAQWGGFVHSTLGRNFGQATASFAENWFDRSADGKPVYRSTADIPALLKIEDIYRKLETPQWNDLVRQGVVKAVNPQSAERGKALYQKNCQSCHAVQPELTPPNKYGYQFWASTMVRMKDIGTDPVMLQQLYGRSAIIPDLLVSDYKALFGPNSIGSGNEVNAFQYRTYGILGMLNTYFEENHYSALDRLKATGCRERIAQSVVGYRARSLEGAVFAAPFLHNGSVPTLVDLLKPANERPKSFYVGCPDYDAVNMGYRCDPNSVNTAQFDTTIMGNSNAGHEYGTDLKPNQRLDLIEYLKTLTPRARPPQNAALPCGPL